jgi:hypothetical protein
MSGKSGPRDSKSLPFPLIERNEQRAPRLIYFKRRPLSGTIKGAFSKNLGSFSYWALEIGDYTHELDAEEGPDGRKNVVHFRGIWMAPPTLRVAIGRTKCSDGEIDEAG